MAQTILATSWLDAEVHVNGLGTGNAWTDITGQGASIAIAGGERSHGEQNTMGEAAADDIPIVGAGKLSARTLTCRFVYTESATEAFEVVRALHEAHGGTIYVQYKAKASGKWFKTGKAVNKTLLYPGGEAGTGDILMSEFMCACASVEVASASDPGA